MITDLPILDIENLKPLISKNFVFYNNYNIRIYKINGQFVLVENGNTIATTQLPIQYHYFSCIQDNDTIVFNFNTNKFIEITADKCIKETMDERLNIITDIYKFNDNYVFGNMNQMGISIILYCLSTKTKKIQTKTWKVNGIDSFKVNKNLVYAVLDKSFIICHDLDNGELLWKKFHTSPISNILPYRDGIVYCCQDLLKKSSISESVTIKTPYIQVENVLLILENRLYFVSSDNKIYCFDLINEKIEWETKIKDKPIEAVVVKAFYKNKIRDILVLLSKDQIIFINAHRGSIDQYFVFPDMQKIKLINNDILINTSTDRTIMLLGSKNVTKDIF